jgi:hypothetical protein
MKKIVVEMDEETFAIIEGVKESGYSPNLVLKVGAYHFYDMHLKQSTKAHKNNQRCFDFEATSEHCESFWIGYHKALKKLTPKIL